MKISRGDLEYVSPRMNDSSDWSRRKLLQVALGGLATAACGPALSNSPGTSATSSDSSNGALGQSTVLQQIDTFVILCMENRSYDHWYGSRRVAEGLPGDGLTGLESNPAPDGSVVKVFPQTLFQQTDLPHEWDDAHAQFDGGKNDGFVKNFAGKNQTLPMGYFTRQQAPISYALADNATLCDRYFCSVLGPTWPNRFFLLGGTSGGHHSKWPMPGFHDLFSSLNRAGVSNRYYFHDIPWALAYGKLTGYGTIERFYEDALGGTLPSVSLIDPRFWGSHANDNHPAHDVRLGEALIGSVYAALSKSPQWGRCMLLVTYDENGGFFDHVPPPTTVDSRADFRQLGFRVPTVVAGPFFRPGAVVSTQLEHCSVLATLQRRFGLGAFNDRVTAANDFSSLIDPNMLSRPAEPRKLPTIDIPNSVLGMPDPSEDEHPDMTEMLKENPPPAGLDRRGSALLTKNCLAWAQELGVIRLT